MIKKRQHYVSRYYLQSWAKNEQIYCFRDNQVFKTNLVNIAQEKYFYELQDLTEDEIILIHKLAIEPSPRSIQESHLDFLNKYLMVFRFEKNIISKIKNWNAYKNDFEELLKQHKINFEENYHASIENIGNKYLDLLRNNNINFFYDDSTEDRMAFLIFIVLQYMRTKKRRNVVIREFICNL